MKDQQPLTIVRFTARNVKAVTAVEIEPTAEGLVIVSGKNGQGKTSVLDAMWLALGGREASKDVDKIIRAGEQSAEAEVDLGELKVRRRWSLKDDGEVSSTIEVRNAEGAKFDRPQSILNKLFGVLSFDPLAFANWLAAEQVAALMKACGEEDALKSLDEKRAEQYAIRTEENREARAARGGAARIPEHGTDVPDDEISTADIVDEIAEAEWKRSANEGARELYATRVYERDQTEHDLEEARRAVSDLELHLKECADARRHQQEVVEALVEPPDIDELKAKGANLDETNAKVREKKRRAELLAGAAEHEKLAGDLSAEIDAVDAKKAAIIAGAKLPVDGIDFGPAGVTHEGIPFTDLAESLKLRISMGLAMAMNPTLRVIRITNGAALDTENMQLFREMAEDRGYQIWIERVEDDSDGVIVIEDGAVVE